MFPTNIWNKLEEIKKKNFPATHTWQTAFSQLMYVQGWDTVQHRWIGHLSSQNRRLDVLKELIQRRSEAAINLEESLPRSPNVYVRDSGGGLQSVKQWMEGEREERLSWSSETTNTCRGTTPTLCFHSLLPRRALLLLTQNTLHSESLRGSLSTCFGH